MSAPPPAPLQKGHTRNPSTDDRRVPIPRRRTKGPLDLDDPPFSPTSPIMSTPPLLTPPTHPNSRSPAPSPPPKPQTHDLSFLLHPSNFHPLPLHILPGPFLSAPSPTGTSSQLLSTFHFRAAAISAATALTSLPPPPNHTILQLWYTRLLSLILSHCRTLAAQEIKAFQDLNSGFYNDPISGRSILPWELRVLAVTLQQDARRQVAAYYDLAAECRVAAMDMAVAEEERGRWRKRLAELGVRVANSLIQLGDLAAAARHLKGLKAVEATTEVGLVYLRAGMVKEAAECLGGDDERMKGLVAMADGRWKEAVDIWGALNDEVSRNNAAVCWLYLGKLEEARKILEGLVEEGKVSEGLIFNLATVYELCGETSKTLKLQLAEKVAAHGREFTNSAFKM
ncbi:hypothetical protein BZA77DRAFT_315082 [Pyronema omphalodes]|nr:hypothetical protein BZA77DRAFT_315082 [Pyronema omphalodes]